MYISIVCFLYFFVLSTLVVNKRYIISQYKVTRALVCICSLKLASVKEYLQIFLVSLARMGMRICTVHTCRENSCGW